MEASAVDTDLNGDYVCFGGPHRLTIVKPFRTTPVRRHRTPFQRLDILRWQKESRRDSSNIAVTSGANVHIYEFGYGDLREIYTGCAHPYIINDFDWSSANPDLFVTCSIRDSIKVWDLRHMSPAFQLKSVTGAEQAKWAPHQDSVLCTASGADLRIWDLRQPKFPIQLVEAHIDKVKCLAWLPKRPSSFVSSSLDCYVKFWNAGDLSKPFRSIGKLEDPVWKLQFSYNGDEFATLSKRSYGRENFSNTVTVFKTKDPMRFQTLKSKQDDIVDICWRGSVKKRPTDCLFSVSKSGRLRRFEINTLSVADIRVPIAASEDDDDMRVTETEIPTAKQQPFTEFPSSHSSGHHERSTSGCSEKFGCKTYVRVTNVGNSIGTELNILSALKAPNLSTDEINYERAVVVFTYNHPGGKKIRFCLRFHASNAKFHKLLLEIIEDESELNEEQGALLLEMMRAHIAGFKSDGSEDTAIASGFKNLPHFIDSMKIFDPESSSVDIESPVEDEDQAVVSDEKIPTTEIFAARDDLVPSPRTCGATFNGSGLLVVFGRVGKKKDEVKALPLMFSSVTKHVKRSLRDAIKEETERVGRSSFDPQQIPILSLPDSHRSTPMGHRPSYEEDVFSISIPSSARSMAKRAGHLDVISPRIKMTVNGRASDLYDSTYEAAESASEVSKISISAPLLIVRSQRHSGNARMGLLADDHYMIAEAKLVSKVIVYDASELLPVSKVLARHYRLLGGSPLDVCLHNMNVAEWAGRIDLFQIWSVVELWVRTALDRMTEPSERRKSSVGEGLFVPVDDEQFWDCHPGGVPLLQDLLDHCEKIGDYQTAALVLCTIAPRFLTGVKTSPKERRARRERLISSGRDSPSLQLKPISSISEYHERNETHLRKTVAKKSISKLDSERKNVPVSRSPSATPTLSTSAPAAVAQSPPRKFSFFGLGRKPRPPTTDRPSTSHMSSEAGTASVVAVPGIGAELSQSSQQDEILNETVTWRGLKTVHDESDPLHRLVTPEVRSRMVKFLHDYIEMLYRWRIYTKAAELLKYSDNAPRSYPLSVAYDNKCCGRGCGRVGCQPPRAPFYCAVCLIVVKGLLTTCAACKHGGHIEHLALWFQDNIHCPTGCRCQCTKYR